MTEVKRIPGLTLVQTYLYLATRARIDELDRNLQNNQDDLDTAKADAAEMVSREHFDEAAKVVGRAKQLRQLMRERAVERATLRVLLRDAFPSTDVSEEALRSVEADLGLRRLVTS